MLLLLLIFVPIIGIFIILAGTSFNPVPANFSDNFPPLASSLRAEGEKNWPAEEEEEEETEEENNNHTTVASQLRKPIGKLGGYKFIKLVALGASLVNLLISLLVFTIYDFSSNQFQFVQEYHQVSFFDFYLGLDGLSIYFVLLTTIIIPIALLSN